MWWLAGGGAECELHILNGAADVLVVLAAELLFGGPLPDHVGGVILFEIGCCEVLLRVGLETGWIRRMEATGNYK